MGRGRSYWNGVCGCDSCHAFNPAWSYPYRGRAGACGVCGRERVELSGFVPEVVAEFLRTADVCQFCRNSINHALLKVQKMCWGSTPYDLLKWGMAWWLADTFFNGHFFPNHWRFVERDCCRQNLHAAA